MKLASDNTAGASPEILEALIEANQGAVGSYGGDSWSKSLDESLSEVFETEVAAFPVLTGTAANSLALATLTPSHGGVFCHELSHIYHDEYGAPEFFSGGARLNPIPGLNGKLDLEAIRAMEVRFPAGDAHRIAPTTISVTQLTEYGTAYSLDELAAIGEYAKTRNLALHMDGARFANALVSTGCSPAEMTWKVGVDALSFGATKNGALAAEAVIFFDKAKAESFEIKRKRSGHLLSKLRFMSAQLAAYLKGDLWIRNAQNANLQAKKIAALLEATADCSLAYPVDGNMLFARIPDVKQNRLKELGFEFYEIPEYGEGIVRMVTAFNTSNDDVAAIEDVIRN